METKTEHFLNRTGLRLPDEMILCYCARDENLEPGVRYGPVIRDVFVVECCTGGRGSVIVNGREFAIQSGDCYILLPGDTVIHTADSVEPRSGVWCFIDGMRVGDCLRRAGIRSDQPFAPPEAFAGITAAIEEMLAMRSDKDPGADLRRSATICNLLGELLRHSPAAEDQSECIAKALRIMEARYDKPITVSDIAAQAGLERCWFSTVFKSHTGLSPYDYLTRLRIKKACSLLRQADCSVGVAAASVGINPENFARIFKRYMGISPSAYKKGDT